MRGRIALHHVEDRLEIHVALTERAIAGEVRPADEVLQMHVHGDRQKVLHHLGRVSSTLLQLPDIRGEFQMRRVDASMAAFTSSRVSTHLPVCWLWPVPRPRPVTALGFRLGFPTMA